MRPTDRPRGFKAFLERLSSEPIAAFTALIFLANAGYLVVSAFSLRALYQSNEGSQRAWVLIAPISDPPKLPLQIEADKPFDIWITAENVGKSPAKNLRLLSAGWVRDLPLRKPPDDSELYRLPPDAVPSVGVIGPGHKFVIDYLRNRVNQGQLDAINRGDAAFYLFGRITYSDQFSDDRLTRYCFFWRPGMKPGSVDVCPVYNEVR